MNATTPLEIELRRLIAAEGPMPVGHFMSHCLYHPRHGYYMTRDPFGARGDFVTAPEVSQIFGELLGLWAANIWQRMGAPNRFLWVELGPGRGTLMMDALRAGRVVPGFLAAAEIHLVEISPVLRARQAETLSRAGVSPVWHDDLTSLPELPAIVLANEFFDALPVFQYVKAEDGWHERCVGLDEAGRLSFVLAPVSAPHVEAVLPTALKPAPLGAVFEVRADRVIGELCRRIATHGGAALIVDYGHMESGFGDTLQAVKNHRFVGVLETPGEADLTAHVDFAALAAAARQAGIEALGPMRQGDFLRQLGIDRRAARLKASASSEQAAAIDVAVHRLTGSGREAMGELFKVLVLAHQRLGLHSPIG